MKRVKMIMSGVVALALVCFFSVPMVQAQDLDGTTHEMKLSGSLAVIEDDLNPNFSREGGSETAPVILRDAGINVITGLRDYEIYVLSEGAPFCQEDPIGSLSTYPGENEAIGVLNIPNFTEVGIILVGRFFAQVKTKIGKSGFKSVDGWAEVGDGVEPDPDGIYKKIKVKAKEKAPEKLGLQCTVQ